MLNTQHSGPGVVRALVVASLLVGASSAGAQERIAADVRWLGWVDCWEPATAPSSTISIIGQPPTLCVVPAQGTSAVEMVTIVDGEVVSRERVEATGSQVPLVQEGCQGWHRAQWSETGTRLYLRSEATCEGGLMRRSTGMMTMVSPSEWVDVQAVTVGERTGVRVLRYRQASARVLPDEVAAAVRGRSLAAGTARVAAAGEITDADLVDASRQVDASVIEAWLVERNPVMSVTGKQLMQLADAGVPESVLDLVVALANQDKFTVNSAERVAMATEVPRTAGGAAGVDPFYDPFYDPFWDGYGRYGRYGRYSMYDRYGYSRYGYSSFGYGYSYRDRPVVVVVTPSSPTEPTRQGRAVKGRGYTRSGSSGSTSDKPSTRTGRTESSGGSASAGGSTSSGGSKSGGSGGRTAKPRPPK